MQVMKKPAGLETTSADDGSLEHLKVKTKGFLEKMGTPDARGVYFYEKGSAFCINFQFENKPAKVATKASSKDDAEAERQTHIKFHQKVESVLK